MHISVAICTWNRARLLDQTLGEMHTLTVPPGVTWELLVVNNNCTDKTDEVISRHSIHLPIRRIFEPQPGQCHARNAAIAAATGGHILFTDDDVLVDAHWLAEYAAAFRRWPDAAYFGGLIEPHYERHPPPWVEANLRSLEAMLVVRNLGPVERRFAEDEWPFGASMAFRRDALLTVRFDPRIGLRQKDNVRGDETAVIQQLRRMGKTGVWVPNARLRHYVIQERLTPKYLWNFYKGAGVTYVKMYGLPNTSDQVLWFGAPRYAYRVALEHRALAMVQWLRGKPDWVAPFRTAAWFCGIIDEVRRSRPHGGELIEDARLVESESD